MTRELHPINLCDTVEHFPVYVLLPCLPRPKPQAFYPLNPDEESTRRHEWPDGKGARCAHCFRLFREVRVRINPRTNAPMNRQGALALAIANRQADVPPIEFTEGWQ